MILNIKAPPPPVRLLREGKVQDYRETGTDMARPRKAKDDLAVRKEVYATAGEWAEIAAAAGSAGLSISQYLMARHRTGAVAAPTLGPERLLAVARLQAEVEALAAAVVQMPAAPILLARLVKLEESLTAIARETAA